MNTIRITSNPDLTPQSAPVSCGSDVLISIGFLCEQLDHFVLNAKCNWIFQDTVYGWTIQGIYKILNMYDYSQVIVFESDDVAYTLCTTKMSQPRFTWLLSSGNCIILRDGHWSIGAPTTTEFSQMQDVHLLEGGFTKKKPKQELPNYGWNATNPKDERALFIERQKEKTRKEVLKKLLHRSKVRNPPKYKACAYPGEKETITEFLADFSLDLSILACSITSFIQTKNKFALAASILQITQNLIHTPDVFRFVKSYSHGLLDKLNPSDLVQIFDSWEEEEEKVDKEPTAQEATQTYTRRLLQGATHKDSATFHHIVFSNYQTLLQEISDSSQVDAKRGKSWCKKMLDNSHAHLRENAAIYCTHVDELKFRATAGFMSDFKNFFLSPIGKLLNRMLSAMVLAGLAKTIKSSMDFTVATNLISNLARDCDFVDLLIDLGKRGITYLSKLFPDKFQVYLEKLAQEMEWHALDVKVKAAMFVSPIVVAQGDFYHYRVGKVQALITDMERYRLLSETLGKPKPKNFESRFSDFMYNLRGHDNRCLPFVVALVGPAGVGKTSMVQKIWQLSKVAWLLPDAKAVAITPDAKFDDPYAGEEFVLLDDIGVNKPEMTQEPPFERVINIVQRVKNFSNQSEAENKGRVPWNVKTLCLTSNVERLGAYHYMSNPLALLRRLHIYVEVNPVDANKYQADGYKFDRINFEEDFQYVVKEAVPEFNPDQPNINPIRNAMRAVHTFTRRSEFFKYIHEKMLQHVEYEKNFVADTSDLCMTCFHPTNTIDCTCGWADRVDDADILLDDPHIEVPDDNFYFGDLPIHDPPDILPPLVPEERDPLVFGNFVPRPAPLAPTHFVAASGLHCSPRRLSIFSIIAFVVCFWSAIRPILWATLPFMWANISYVITFVALFTIAVWACTDYLDALFDVEVWFQTFSCAQKYPQLSYLALKYRILNLYMRRVGIPYVKEHRFKLTLLAASLAAGTLYCSFTAHQTKTKKEKFTDLDTPVVLSTAANGVASHGYSRCKKRTVTITNGSKWNYGQILDSNRILTVAHLFEDTNPYSEIVVTQEAKGKVVFTHKITMKNVSIFADKDVAILTVPDNSTRYSSMFHSSFTAVNKLDIASAYYYYDPLRDTLGTARFINSSSNITYSSPLQVMRPALSLVFHSQSRPIQPGDCGIIIFDSWGENVGMIVATAEDSNTFVAIPIPSVQLTPQTITTEVAPSLPGSLTDKVFFATNSSPMGGAIKIAEIHGMVNKTGRSMAKQSYFADLNLKVLGSTIDKTKYGPPSLWRGGSIRKNFDDSCVRNTTILKTQKSKIDSKIMRRAIDDYFETVKATLTPTDIKKIHPETMYNALSALEHGERIPCLKPMKMNTAVGYPFASGKKRDHISLNEGRVEFSRDFAIFIERFESMLLKGQTPFTLSKIAPKDEVVKISKTKTRLFYSGDSAMFCLTRKYFWWLPYLVYQHPLAFECAYGINPYSQEWQDMQAHLDVFENNMAADFGDWDLRLPQELTAGAFEILERLSALGTGFPPEKEFFSAFKNLFISPLALFGTHIYNLEQGTPSGHSFTYLFNSFANSIRSRYCFYTLFPNKKYSDHVRSIFGGDDAKETTNLYEFNQLTTLPIMLSMGLKPTDSNKKEISTPFTPREEVTFLKRDSRGRIDPNTIEKLLTWTISRDLISHASGALISALFEIRLYGKEAFDDFVDSLRRELPLAHSKNPANGVPLDYLLEDKKRFLDYDYEGYNFTSTLSQRKVEFTFNKRMLFFHEVE